MVEKHRSEEGYNNISKSLVIPLSMMKSIIKKWKTYHTTQTLLRASCLSKRSSRASRKLVCDVTGNPTMALKDLQGSMSEMGVSVHQSTISHSPHRAGVYGQVTRKKPLLKNMHLKAHMEFAKSILIILQACRETFCG